MEPAKVLVVDDEPSILRLLNEALTQWGYQVTTAANAREAIEALRTGLFDAAITDIRMPDMGGLELLREIKKHDDAIEVLVMTGYPTIASAVEALKEGAYDYLSKPLILDELRHLMARVTERRFLKGEVHSLRARLGEELVVNELVGNSPPMQRVKDIIAKVAATDSPVLIEGDSGTGKELVAAAIHRLSARVKGPFIPVNCSAIPEDLLESEFFGHVRGAFSGAVSDALGLFRGAHDGTIFLDEIAELSPALQVKLLRVLQEMLVRPVGSTKAYPVDVRVIAATNRDIETAIADGRFRQDLYYRLNVVRISLPPLRARRDDIPALVNHFLRRFNRRFRRDVRGIAPDALAALSAYDFPGNVRELENLIERAFAMGAREQITLGDLPSLAKPVVVASGVATGAIPQLADVEKELILRALAYYTDDKEAAARALGISRRTIYRRLKEYGML
ncbi:MAG: sigma-54-dependent Fis family transcriptional regulator [Candidatus Rokubacteria bacterium]|nr:sigma-54-dependent Fis family transcriptional regulator [Candidatus Rokubacteria bacterium]MBI2491379.1 sigma-54-dependent Fis family transcriptional regulator [Candidatus Rokubacteria bacterium]MBI4629814.1 sigma-54-dependent Fis family transcriptional regulator [Candidatus Rokubacteria bacterium]